MEVVPTKQHDRSLWSKHNIIALNLEEEHPRIQCNDSYLDLWKSGDFSDAVIHVQGFDFKVHRNILACCSEYFRALFTDKMQHAIIHSVEEHVPRPHYLKAQEQISGSKRLKPHIIFTSSKSQSTSTTSSSSSLTSSTQYNNTQNQTTHSSSANLTHLPNMKNQLDSCSRISNCSSRNKSSKGKQNSTQDRSNHSVLTQLDTPSEGHTDASGVKSGDSGKERALFHVTLDEVKPDVMSLILEHAYGGVVTLNQDNVEQLLTAADRFQITKLTHECAKFLSDTLCVDNCISIFKFSSNFFDCSHLKKRALRYILDNFEELYKKSAEFEHLTPTELSEFVREDSLNVRREESVMDAIFTWVAADHDHREAFITPLVKCVRIGCFLPGSVFSTMLLNRYSNENGAFSKRTMLKIMEAVVERQKELVEGAESLLFEPRLPRDLLFVIGGSNFGYPLGIVEVFDSRTRNWNRIAPNVHSSSPRSYHGTAYVDKAIYIIGGFDGQAYLSSCCKCSPEQDGELVTLKNVTPMHSRRCYVGVAQVHDLIYAIGGFDGVYRLNSAERFDYKTNQWTFIAPMSHHRSDAGVTVHDDKIYVCGGFSGTECTRTMEVFDPTTEEWTPQPPMPDAKSGLGLTSYGECLYAVGGFNGLESSVRLPNMDCYNTQTRQWTALTSMTHPRSNMAVAVLEDTLYAIGGYNGERTSSLVECYDFQRDRWYRSTRLSQSRSALSVCVISDLPNIASIVRRDTRRTVSPEGQGDEEDIVEENEFSEFNL